jgi:hypothetical protein
MSRRSDFVWGEGDEGGGKQFFTEALVKTAFSNIIYINFHTPPTFIFFYFIYSSHFPLLCSLSLSL